MKTYGLYLWLMMVCLSAWPLHAAESVTQTFQQALLEEEGNQNIEAAIKAYQTVIEQMDSQRKLAATAIFRLGECYRKLGRTNEAIGQYQRLIRDFPGEETLTRLSRQNLTGLGNPLTPTTALVPKSETAPSVVVLRKEYETLKLQLQTLHELGTTEQQAFIQVTFPDVRLTELIRDESVQQQKYLQASPNFGAEHPEMKKLEAILKLLSEQIASQSKALVLAQELRLKALGQTLGAFADKPGIASGASAESPGLTDQTNSVTRLEKILKDSPDLLDADGAELRRAIQQSDIAAVRFLIGHHADVNRISSNGLTPLENAARYGDVETLQLLLDTGAIITGDRDGFTPLHAATRRGHLLMCEILIKHKADVNAQAKQKVTPLHLAADKGFVNIAELLLNSGTDVNAATSPENPINNSTIRPGSTPLTLAVEQCDLAMTELLLKHRVDVNLARQDGYAPLHLAIGGSDPRNISSRKPCGNLELIKRLLAQGAEVNARGFGQLTVLHMAVNIQNEAICELLLKNGADLNAQDADGSTPLIYAVSRNSITMTRLLLAHKPDLTTLRREPGTTALGMAMYVQNPLEISEALLRAGADPNESLLHSFIQRGLYDLLELFLRYGADVNKVNNEGVTPLEFALQIKPSTHPSGVADLERMITLLREKGAVTDAPNPNSIRIRRQSEGYISTVFRRGDPAATMEAVWQDRFTLRELLAVHYQLLDTTRFGADKPQNEIGNPRPRPPGSIATPTPVPSASALQLSRGLSFPDFERITIHRLAADGKTTAISVNLLAALKANDCTVNPVLEWGDVVELPAAEHPLNASWGGLSSDLRQVLGACLSKIIYLSIKGVTSQEAIAPNNGSNRITSGYLYQALRQSNRLLNTSNLGRVTVVRKFAETINGEMVEKELQRSLNFVSDATDDLWLQDGDVIRVPDQMDNFSVGEVLIFGEVKTSGPYQIKSILEASLFEAVVKVGYTENANLKSVQVNRINRDTQQNETLIVNLEAVRKGDRSQDITLKPGDRVEVGRKPLF